MLTESAARDLYGLEADEGLGDGIASPGPAVAA
jgi:hypothetical protein